MVKIVPHKYTYKRAVIKRATTREIIVHCSATPEGNDFTVEDIDRWHKQRDFACIGYHYVIYRDGSIHQGRPIGLQGAHTNGRNPYSIGICYIGGLATDAKTPKDTRTEAQTASMVALIKHLRSEFGPLDVRGHYEFAKKACPSFRIEKLKALLKVAILAILPAVMSCKHTETITEVQTVPEYHHTEHTITQRDSVYLHDSTMVQLVSRNDTIYKETVTYKYQNRYKIITDTLHQRDTLVKVVEVPRIINKTNTAKDKTSLAVFYVLLAQIIILSLLFFRRKRG